MTYYDGLGSLRRFGIQRMPGPGGTTVITPTGGGFTGGTGRYRGVRAIGNGTFEGNRSADGPSPSGSPDACATEAAGSGHARRCGQQVGSPGQAHRRPFEALGGLFAEFAGRDATRRGSSRAHIA